MGSRQARFATSALVTLIVVAVSACGSKSPTGPPVTPPPVTPPPSPGIQLDWVALTRLFDDPLFLSLPELLENQTAAAPIRTAVLQLVTGIHAKNYDLTRSALLDLGSARQTYGLAASHLPTDNVPLIAMSVFELRGWKYVAAANSGTDAEPIVESRPEPVPETGL